MMIMEREKGTSAADPATPHTGRTSLYEPPPAQGRRHRGDHRRLLMTACRGSDTDASQNASSSTPSGNSTTASGSSTADDSRTAAENSAGASKGTQDGSGSGNGGKGEVGQICGVNDISWSTTSETQAGGYTLIIAKAKSGITCILPAALPMVAFGSDGTEAGPAEQSAGKQITLSGGTTAYAGVNTKSTGGNGAKS